MVRFATILSALLLSIGSPVPSSAETYYCRVETKRHCAFERCKALPAKGEVTVIDTDKRQYLLCADDRKCQTFPLEAIRHSGVFVIFSSTPGTYLKMVHTDLKN